jgi:hypothetical protein
MKDTMNPKLSTKAIQRGLWLGALLLGTAATSANTLVTFQVDMSNASLPAGQTVAARGTFDGWASPGFGLTNNPAGANPNLWSGTYNDTTDANGAAMAWQFVMVSGGSIATYSSQGSGYNYCATLPAASGASFIIPVVFWDDDGAPVANSITFQVDMAEQLHLGNFNTSDGVFCQGNFEGWSDANFPLTNNPALNVTNAQGIVTSLPYQGTYTTWLVSPGEESDFKYVYNDGTDHYEGVSAGNANPDGSGNRFFMNEPGAIPIVSYGDAPFSDTVTNNVTFIVDMSVQAAVGSFNAANGANTVEIHGDYNGWGPGTTMTNNPSDPNLNHFYFNWQYIGGQGSLAYFKYVIQPGTQWENVSAANQIGGNRWLALAKGNTTNSPVYFSDEAPSSLVDFITISNCYVTFTVDMTPAVTSGAFTPGFDNVALNGINGGVDNSYWTWSALEGAPAQYIMTQLNGAGNIYTINVPVNQGQPLDLTYKYGIDGQDNEAGQGDNHSRYVRSLLPGSPTQASYAMPTDVFGSQANSTSSESSFGNFTVGDSNNNISLTWLGRTGVRLQSTTSLTPPIVWTQLPLTDGTNLIVTQGPGSSPSAGYATTNYPIGSGNKYFELIGPP